MEPARVETPSEDTVQRLLQLIAELVREVHPYQPSTTAIALDSTFERDLGLDSLARVELISRVERQFGLALPERTFAEAETTRDLLRALQGTQDPLADLSAAQQDSLQTGTAMAAPAEAQTLVEVLDWHMEHHPDRTLIQIYRDGGGGDRISYRQLREGAARVAAGLQQRGLIPAEPVMLMLPSGPDYFYSFFGVLMSGGIPVPVYPPARPSQLEDHMRRHVHILNNCRAVTLITVAEARHVAQLLRSQTPNLQHIVSVSELMEAEEMTSLPVLGGKDIAFIQYTSGSTGNPKGVVLTHANLLANIRAMGQVVACGPEDVFVSWLPLYHDMGLIGAWLGSMYYAALFVVMSPLSFLARPERWLWAIHHYRGTLSASPNFGYEYCLRRIRSGELEGLDLSSWRAAFNGAEAVSADTLQEFSQQFSRYGFRPEAMMPVYGLAESSVGLAFPPPGRGPLIDRVERTTFMRSGHARPATDSDKHALKFPCNGSPLPGHQVRVVDPAGHELPERREGRLQFRGPSATSGYYRDAEKTQSLFSQDWLESGDLAYIANGEIYITGRVKDIIIRAGRNIYPHELEEAVGNIPGIRKGRVAVFGSKDAKSGTERLIVLTETRSKDPAEIEKLRAEINALATDLIGAPPDQVVLAPPGTVLKTSSGKIRRTASREIFEKGELGRGPRSLPWQVARLTVASIVPQLRRSLRYAGTFLFSVYAWFVFILLAPVAWLSAIILPDYSMRWSALRACSRLLAKATATPISINNLENLPADESAYVLVSNHCSYIDSFALVAMLPRHFRFVAKGELANSPVIRRPLANIHTEFVERFDTGKSVRDSRRLTRLLKQGHALTFFAEGTFTRVPGLMPFHLGAFSVAAEAGTAVVPLAIRGTRSILRSDSWFVHRGSIHIEIGEPIDPQDFIQGTATDTWRVAIALRDRSRSFILRHCGEPDLAR